MSESTGESGRINSPQILSFPAGTTADALVTGDMMILSESNNKGSDQDQEKQLLAEQRAKEIMEENYFGFDEVSSALDLRFDRTQVPKIPFTEAELQHAVALDQRLVLRFPSTSEGDRITMMLLEDAMREKFSMNKWGNVLYAGNTFNPNSQVKWYQAQPFFTTDTPRPGWALTTNRVISGSTTENYLEQTARLIRYIKNEVFKETPLPPEYVFAIREFEGSQRAIRRLLSPVWGYKSSKIDSATKRLLDLEINKMARPSPVEVFYDHLVYKNSEATFGRKLLSHDTVWTNVFLGADKIVAIGDTPDGMWPLPNSPIDEITVVGSWFTRV